MKHFASFLLSGLIFLTSPGLLAQSDQNTACTSIQVNSKKKQLRIYALAIYKRAAEIVSAIKSDKKVNCAKEVIKDKAIKVILKAASQSGFDAQTVYKKAREISQEEQDEVTELVLYYLSQDSVKTWLKKHPIITVSLGAGLIILSGLSSKKLWNLFFAVKGDSNSNDQNNDSSNSNNENNENNNDSNLDSRDQSESRSASESSDNLNESDQGLKSQSNSNESVDQPEPPIEQNDNKSNTIDLLSADTSKSFLERGLNYSIPSDFAQWRQQKKNSSKNTTNDGTVVEKANKEPDDLDNLLVDFDTVENEKDSVDVGLVVSDAVQELNQSNLYEDRTLLHTSGTIPIEKAQRDKEKGRLHQREPSDVRVETIERTSEKSGVRAGIHARKKRKGKTTIDAKRRKKESNKNSGYSKLPPVMGNTQNNGAPPIPDSNRPIVKKK